MSPKKNNMTTKIDRINRINRLKHQFSYLKAMLEQIQ